MTAPPRLLRAFLLTTALAGTLHAFEQVVTITPGQYETTATMEMPGMKMPPQKDQECITAADLKDFSKKLIDPDMYRGCKVSNYKVAGNKLSFNLSCKDGDLAMTGTTEMTFAADAFTTFVRTEDDKGRVTTIRGNAKRIGDCRK